MSSGDVNKLGHVELLGDVSFIVTSGVTVAGQIEMTISPIPFADISGLTITTTGGMAGAAVSVMNQRIGLVRGSVPAGAVVRDTVTISGLRISVPNYRIVSLDVQIATTNNTLAVGQDTVTEIRESQDNLFVAESTNLRTPLLPMRLWLIQLANLHQVKAIPLRSPVTSCSVERLCPRSRFGLVGCRRIHR